MNGLVALALDTSFVHVSGNSSNGRTLRLEEVCLCKESVLHSGPTEIPKNSKTNNAISKQAHGQYIMHTKSKALSWFT